MSAMGKEKKGRTFLPKQEEDKKPVHPTGVRELGRRCRHMGD